MRLLFCGDIVGRPGRDILFSELPRLRRELELDFVVVNGENAAGGFGITPKLADSFLESGIDVITTGNHAWDQREIIPYFTRQPRLLRPCNYPRQTPGLGHGVFEAQNGGKVLVINVMARMFMDPLDDPFTSVDQILEDYSLGTNVSAVVVDVHGEASSEKQAIGHHLDGRASLVVGSHTHTPTADTQIFDLGTAYQTDAGMCGNYNSVIGSDKSLWVAKFRTRRPVGRIPSEEGNGTLCGVFVELNSGTGLALSVSPVIVGDRLPNRMPDLKSYRIRNSA